MPCGSPMATSLHLHDVNLEPDPGLIAHVCVLAPQLEVQDDRDAVVVDRRLGTIVCGWTLHRTYMGMLVKGAMLGAASRLAWIA